MTSFSYRKVGLALATAATATLAPTAVAHAAQAPITYVETNHTQDQWVAVDSTFDWFAARDIGLDALKQIRGEAWDQSLPFDGESIRTVAQRNGLTSRSAYVNAVSIDENLVRTAVQRAMEETTASGIDHVRPYNATCRPTTKDCKEVWSAKANGQAFHAENLALDRDLRSAILEGWGRGEIADLKASNGFQTASNGHLRTLMNPQYRAYGFADVTAKTNGGSRRAQSTAASFEVLTPHTGSLPGGTQHVWLYRAANGSEQPTGLKNGTPPVTQPDYPGENPTIPLPGGENSSISSEGDNSQISTILGVISGLVGLGVVIYNILIALGII